VAVVVLLAASAVGPALANPIIVTTTRQGVTDPRNCSLQEAIHSANFHQALAIDSTNPDHFYATGCMTAGEIDSLTLTIFIPSSVVKGRQIKNSVSITSTTPDPNPANNSASVLATIQ